MHSSVHYVERHTKTNQIKTDQLGTVNLTTRTPLRTKRKRRQGALAPPEPSPARRGGLFAAAHTNLLLPEIRIALAHLECSELPLLDQPEKNQPHQNTRPHHHTHRQSHHHRHHTAHHNQNQNQERKEEVQVWEVLEREHPFHPAVSHQSTDPPLNNPVNRQTNQVPSVF